MVLYFKARPEVGDYTIYMGLDKNENEELIKYGFPEDIWFHVDKMSSAHVYLRLNKNQTIDDISEGLLEDCAQLVKANSIQAVVRGYCEVGIQTLERYVQCDKHDHRRLGCECCCCIRGCRSCDRSATCGCRMEAPLHARR